MTNEAATTRAPGARGAYAKSVARRRELVEAATELFAREGYRSATMLQIAEACGISRTGLLHHFPTKESLLEAVLFARDEATAAYAVVVDDSAIPALQPLLRTLKVVEYNTTIPAIITLYSVLSAEAADPTHPAHAYFVERYARSRDDFAHSFRAVQAAGMLRTGLDPDLLALEQIALWDGLQVQWSLDRASIDMVAVMRRWLDDKLTVPLP